jgi:hypothetical protein
MKYLYTVVGLLIGIPICLLVWAAVFKTLDTSGDEFASLTNEIERDLDKADKNKAAVSDNEFSERLENLRNNAFNNEPSLKYLFPNSPDFILVYKNEYTLGYVDKSSITIVDGTKSALLYSIDIANNLDSLSLDKYNCTEKNVEPIASYLSTPVNKFSESEINKKTVVAGTATAGLFDFVCES